MQKLLLEVGCGRRAGLLKLLVGKGYQMTAMDPQIMPESIVACEMQNAQNAENWQQAQEPCERQSIS